MDVKLIPGDRRGRAVTVNMFTGLFYSVDPTDGSYEKAFDARPSRRVWRRRCGAG